MKVIGTQHRGNPGEWPFPQECPEAAEGKYKKLQQNEVLSQEGLAEAFRRQENEWNTAPPYYRPDYDPGFRISPDGKTIIKNMKKKQKADWKKMYHETSTIILPNKSWVLDFEVSGEFELGFNEEVKGAMAPGKTSRVWGIRFPSCKQINPSIEDKKLKKWFTKKEINKPSIGRHLLQIFVDRAEGTMRFAIDGQKSKITREMPRLLQQAPDARHSHNFVWCNLPQNARAQVTFLRFSRWENERENFLFTAKYCPRSFGNLPYGLFREIVEFIPGDSIRKATKGSGKRDTRKK